MREGDQVAVLGGGCFWCLEAVFQEVAGVRSVQSGYCGGTLDHPDYQSVCAGHTGHAEVVRVVFDPSKLSYRDLLEVFFGIHDPTTPNRQGHDVGTQYRSVIFAQDETQRQIAQALIDEMAFEGVFDAPIVTELMGAEPFWPAEPEHHDYFRRHPRQPYCMAVVAPKVMKFRQHFARLRRAD